MQDLQTQVNIEPSRRRGAVPGFIRTLSDSVGFTLVELIVSIAIFSILMLGVLALTSNAFTVNRQQGLLLANQDQARKLVFVVMSEVRNATTSSTGAYPIDTAGSQQLTFYANIDGGSDVERVRYFLQNSKIYKGVVKPTSSPLVYNLAGETVTLMQNNIAGNPALFTYYDDTYNGVTGSPLTQPVSVTAVRFIKMDIPITNQAGVVNTNSYTITAQATVRNLKTNLGGASPPPAQPPTVDIQANSAQGPITIAYNAAATLTWTSANTTTCTASGGWSGSVGTSGSQSTGALTSNQTYTIQCTGPGGSVNDSVIVNVDPPPLPTVDMQANGSQGSVTVAYNSTATLTWTSSNATTCAGSGGWSGTQALNGSWTSGGLTTDQTYTLQCTGPGGSNSDSVAVTVTPPPPPQPSCVSAAPESTNADGNGTFLLYAYGVQNTTSLQFDVYKGSTEVFVAGSDQGSGTWSGSLDLSQLQGKGWYTVDVLVSGSGYTNVLCASTQFRRR